MAEHDWPVATPRDVVFARVVARGRRIRMANRIMIGLLAGAVATAGGVGFALGATGTVGAQGAQASQRPDALLAFHACPGQGLLGQLHRGDRVLLTGRTDDGRWLQVRAPHDPEDRVWVPAAGVTPDDEDDLPVVDCEPAAVQVEYASGEVVTPTTEADDDLSEDDDPEADDDGDEPEPGELAAPPPVSGTVAPPVPGQPAPSQTTPRPGTPTTLPTTPTTRTPGSTTTAPAGPTTTAAPPAAPPTVGVVQRSHAEIVEDWEGICAGAKTSTISAPVQHATSATMTWAWDGAQRGSKSMTLQGGTASAGLGPFNHTAVAKDEVVTVTVTANGPGGSASRSTTVLLRDCYFG